MAAGGHEHARLVGHIHGGLGQRCSGWARRRRGKVLRGLRSVAERLGAVSRPSTQQEAPQARSA
eukprot:49514-Lingulodinium_polyedra.AAC.1